MKDTRKLARLSQRQGTRSTGCKHGRSWLTPQAVSDPGEEEAAEGEQHRNKEKEEILRLLGEWQERETSPIVRWAWADENREAESTEEEEEKGESGEEEMRWAD